MKKLIVMLVMLMAVTGLAVADDWADEVTASNLDWYYSFPEVNPAEEVEKMRTDEDRALEQKANKLTDKTLDIVSGLLDLVPQATKKAQEACNTTANN